MVNWSGVKAGMEMYQQDKLDDATLEMNQLASRNADETFKMNMKMSKIELRKALRDLAGTSAGFVGANVLPSGGTGKSSKGGLNQDLMVKVLATNFNIDPEVLSEVAANGVTAQGSYNNIKSLYDIAIDTQNKFGSGEYAGDMNEVIGNVVSSRLSVDPKTLTYDWDKIAKETGIDITPEDREVMGESYVIPGQTYFNSPELVKKMQIEDLSKVEQRALDISKNKAISEQTKILKQLNVINTLSKSKDEMVTLSGVTLNKTQLDVAKSYYLNRQETINKATLDLEDNIFGPMISLYGSDMEELSDYYNADGAPLNPAFADAVKLPKMFKDEQELAVMASLGVVKEGDRVSYMKDNQIVEITLR
jgi:hypothetical protein